MARLPIPAPTVHPIDNRTGLWTPVWYQWLLQLMGSGGVPGNLPTHYTQSATTTIADPGAGGLRWNNATQNLATKLAISATNGDTIATNLARSLRALVPGDRLYLQDNPGSAVFQSWQITKVVDQGAWFEIDVIAIASAGGNISGVTDVFFEKG